MASTNGKELVSMWVLYIWYQEYTGVGVGKGCWIIPPFYLLSPFPQKNCQDYNTAGRSGQKWPKRLILGFPHWATGVIHVQQQNFLSPGHKRTQSENFPLRKAREVIWVTTQRKINPLKTQRLSPILGSGLPRFLPIKAFNGQFLKPWKQGFPKEMLTQMEEQQCKWGCNSTAGSHKEAGKHSPGICVWHHMPPSLSTSFSFLCSVQRE